MSLNEKHTTTESHLFLELLIIKSCVLYSLVLEVCCVLLVCILLLNYSLMIVALQSMPSQNYNDFSEVSLLKILWKITFPGGVKTIQEIQLYCFYDLRYLIQLGHHSLSFELLTSGYVLEYFNFPI